MTSKEESTRSKWDSSQNHGALQGTVSVEWKEIQTLNSPTSMKFCGEGLREVEVQEKCVVNKAGR